MRKRTQINNANYFMSCLMENFSMTLSVRPSVGWLFVLSVIISEKGGKFYLHCPLVIMKKKGRKLGNEHKF